MTLSPDLDLPESASATYSTPDRVCSSAPNGCTKAAGHAVGHDVSHASCNLTDLLSSGDLPWLLGSHLPGGSSRLFT